MMTPRQDAEVANPAGFEASLRAAGLRVTAPRLAVLAVVAEHPHSDADAVATAARSRLGAVSRQAVYDVLHVLTAAGLLRRISVDDRRGRYELHRHDNHHHVICRDCGVIVDVPCATGQAPCLDAPDQLGFEIEQADVVFRGLCPACRAVHDGGTDAPAAEPDVAPRRSAAPRPVTTEPDIAPGGAEDRPPAHVPIGP